MKKIQSISFYYEKFFLWILYIITTYYPHDLSHKELLVGFELVFLERRSADLV